MSAAGMATARTARGDAAKACTTDETALARLGAAQAAVRATLPPLPNEKLVYSCDRAR
jgi:hypothetical protein